MRWFLVITLGLLVAALFGGSWYFSNELITQDRRPLELAADELPFEVDDVEVVSDGLTIRGWYVEGTADCGLLFFHGRGMNREQAIDWTVPFEDFDCHLVLFDHRAMGESDGDFHTFGALERDDGALMLELLMRRAELEPSQVGLVGPSYGAATALQMLPDHQDLAFVLADSPYASMYDVAAFQAEEQFGTAVTYLVPTTAILSELRAGFDVQDAAPEQTIVGNDVPVLLMHDVDDPYTPFEHSERIAAADPDGPLELVPFSGDSDHHQMVRTQTARYKAIVSAFISDYAPDFSG